MLDKLIYIGNIVFWAIFFFKVYIFDRTLYFSDKPITIVFWDFAIGVKFIQWLNIFLELNIDYKSNLIVNYLNFFQTFVFSFFIGGVTARIFELLSISKFMKKSVAKSQILRQLNYKQLKKFKSDLVYYLIFNIIAIFSNFLIIPQVRI